MTETEIPAEFYDQNDNDNVCFLCNNPKYVLKYRITHFGFPFTFKTCHCGIEKQTPMPNYKEPNIFCIALLFAMVSDWMLLFE